MRHIYDANSLVIIRIIIKANMMEYTLTFYTFRFIIRYRYNTCFKPTSTLKVRCIAHHHYKKNECIIMS